MAFIDWEPKYSVGHNEIDQQHRQLIDMINKLHTAMKSGQGAREAEAIVDEMVNYSKFHFETEENLMKVFGFIGLLTHKAEHAAFIKQAGDFQTQFSAGKVSLSIEILNFLKDWLTKHILGTDLKYSTMFKK